MHSEVKTVAACCLLALLAPAAGLAEGRPPVDKADVAGRIYVHANPWFPVDMDPRHAAGGPNVPWEHYEGTNSWRRCMEVVQSYGVDGIMVEINEPNAGAPVFRNMLDNAPDGFRIGMFFGFYSRPDAKKSIANTISVLRPFKADIAGNPHLLRAGGKPVMLVYNVSTKQKEFFREVFAGIEAEFGPMVFLLSYSNVYLESWDEQKFEAGVRSLLDVFDGVSSYCFSYEGVGVQRAEARAIARIRRDFPEKLIMGGAFTTWTQPFVQSGLEVNLTRNWRASVDLWMGRETGVDAIELTNLFDHYEQSLVYPCMEREDFVLRYLQCAAAKWRGSRFERMKTPELVLCNYVSAQLGWTPLDFEVVGFPIDSSQKRVSVSVELCDSSGKVLRTLGPRELDLSDVATAWFSVPSVEFASERGVVPRLVYTWNGATHRAPYSPMTLLSPSARNYRLYWARSTKNAYELYQTERTSEDWTLDEVHPGGTRHPTADGMGVFASHARCHDQPFNPRRGARRFGIRRDGHEYLFMKYDPICCEANTGSAGLTSTFACQLLPPGAALHWYQVEYENRFGRRWTSLPVWETDGSRDRLVEMPILDGTNGVVSCRIEECRVPFYHWACARDGGRVLLDESGYVHNGIVNPRPNRPPAFFYVGYNMYHNGRLARGLDFATRFRTDEDGRGCLDFGGKDWAAAFGGTGFPGASTYEISVKPAELGARMGLLNTDIGHVLLSILPDGRVRAARRAAPLPGHGQFDYQWPEVVSEKKVVPGSWTRIAYVYDLRKVSLYMDGELQGSVDAPPCYADLGYDSRANPNTSHECRNGLVIGAEVNSPYTPVNNFRGRLRSIRAYGRNLSPAEFLGAKSEN